MGELASIYNLDKGKAETVGILHDAGKDLPLEEQKKLIVEGGIQIQYDCEHNYLLYLHGPVGSYLIQELLGITDPLVLDAIKTHTSCGDSPYFNHPMSWCLRFADVLEPTRSWSKEPLIQNRIDRFRALVFSGEMDSAVYYQTRMLIEWFQHKGFPVHPNWRRAQKEYGVKVGEW
jgi:predicted HD superfamily hydrolase involved in NAD metabolism